MLRTVKLIVLLGAVTLIFGYIPYTISIFTHTPFLGDLCDVLILLPSFFFVTYILHEDFMKELDGKKWMHYAFIASLLLFVEGHGIHWAANQIHNYMVQGESGFSIAYFLDEVLGHTILFAGAYLSLLFLTIMRIGKVENNSRGEKALLLISSVIFGSFFALGMIEGQVITHFLPIAIAVFLFLLWMMREKKLYFEDSWVFFYLFSHVFFLLIALLYYLLFGGFVQPSELFGF